MSFNYKNPISPLTSLGNISVNRTDVFGTNFSVLGTGGYMEVYSLSDLYFIIPTGTTGLIEYSSNTIPIQINIGSGTVFSPNVLTLYSDNISSGRRKIGMLVYVIDQKQFYQFQIPNYTTLWNSATGATGPGGNTVVFSDFGTTIKSNTSQGIDFISAWTANTIEGVSGYTSSNANWKKIVTGDYYLTSGITSSITLSWDSIYYGVSGSTNVDLILPSVLDKEGYYLVIKDEAGTCGSYRIRLIPSSGTIDGNNYVDMNINFMSLTCLVRNGNWYLI